MRELLRIEGTIFKPPAQDIDIAVICGMVWRRRWDSNPRDPFGAYSLSRGAPSTTRPRLRRRVYWQVAAGARENAHLRHHDAPEGPAGMPLFSASPAQETDAGPERRLRFARSCFKDAVSRISTGRPDTPPRNPRSPGRIGGTAVSEPLADSKLAAGGDASGPGAARGRRCDAGAARRQSSSARCRP